ncbi:RNA-binding protein pop5 [Elasticomyces elasticus]|nr:hypothetical protein LTR28_004459 [Elasticomyces elasticus]KAK5000403.1 RNA-binding protein pop5 [Elasticomyces elasticus]
MVRLKHRYLLVNILYPGPVATPSGKDQQTLPDTIQFHKPTSDSLTPQMLMRLIRDGVAELFGDYGVGVVAGSLQVKYFSAATSTAIVRVSRAHYRLVWAALTFATRLPHPLDEACVMQVVRVSGTIRKSEEEAVRRARMGIRKAQGAGNWMWDESTIGQGRGNLGSEGGGVEGADGIEDIEDDRSERGDSGD